MKNDKYLEWLKSRHIKILKIKDKLIRKIMLSLHEDYHNKYKKL